ncbi:MAG: hypothetical protein AAGG51_21315 [Cyanobacteria bacterium P01_G01_bin.54]
MKKHESGNAKQKHGIDALPVPLVAQALEKTQIGKYHTKGGHGFAAEDANNFSDQIRGKQAKVIGTSNERNGADRLVDGIQVQSKYYRTASETVSSAFDSSSGTYRYSGQVLEVPRDQYDTCLELMRNRIKQGKVPGHSNPADAEKIIRRGTVTYKQARNIARAGNVDSLIFDAKTQAVTSSYVFAVSFAVTFAQGRWCGKNNTEAAKQSLEVAISSGGTTLITGIISAQILRMKAAAIGVASIRNGVKAISGTTVGREAIQRIAVGSLGKAVYGAAAVNHVSKLLRSNAVTATVTAVATSTPDFYRAAFEQSISWRQFTKNVSVNMAGIAAGTAGWMMGAAAGASIGSVLPGAGTVLGGIAGGIFGALGGGFGGSAVAQVLADQLVDDDSKHLIIALQHELQQLASEYLLTETEFEHIGAKANKIVNPQWLRQLFKATEGGMDQAALKHFIRRGFEPQFELMVRGRPKILLPSTDEVTAEIILLTETISDNTSLPPTPGSF